MAVKHPIMAMRSVRERSVTSVRTAVAPKRRIVARRTLIMVVRVRREESEERRTLRQESGTGFRSWWYGQQRCQGGMYCGP